MTLRSQRIEVKIGTASVVGVIGHSIHRNALTHSNIDWLIEFIFNGIEGATLSRQQGRGDLWGYHNFNLGCFLAVQQPSDLANSVTSHQIGRLNFALPSARWAVDVVGHPNTRSHSLASHFENAKLTDRKNGRSGSIGLKKLSKFSIDLAALGHGSHVDEIVDHQTTKIAKTKLAGDLFDCFHIGAVGIGLAVSR